MHLLPFHDRQPTISHSGLVLLITRKLNTRKLNTRKLNTENSTQENSTYENSTQKTQHILGIY